MPSNQQIDVVVLYPLRFAPILKERLWGGSLLAEQLGKPNPQGIVRCGESWEIADVGGESSVVSNGFLAGNTLRELAEVYMADLLGDSVFERYGANFPLLIKLIDAHDDLSIQVHPDDATAQRLHGCSGKSEMWYVMRAEPGATLVSGFGCELSHEELRQHIAQSTLPQVLHREAVAAGDALYIPAGRVHAIGRGILLAEVQQSSDITYRLYDYNRPDQRGELRQLHVDQALAVVDLTPITTAKLLAPAPGAPLLSCPYFSLNRMSLSQPCTRDLSLMDSFVIYICTQGQATITVPDCPAEPISMGQTLLIPAAVKNISIAPTQQSELLEVYI